MLTDLYLCIYLTGGGFMTGAEYRIAIPPKNSKLYNIANAKPALTMDFTELSAEFLPENFTCAAI